MALTPSTMLALGTALPAFSLPDAVSGRQVSSDSFAGRPLLVMFICNHCPYVKHVAAELARLGRDCQQWRVGVVAIQSNDFEAYPEDAPPHMAAEALARGYVFPYLVDADQRVAHAFSAACTPDFFLFDGEHHLVYRGQLDDSRPKRIRSGVYDSSVSQPDGRDLRAALAEVEAGRTPPAEGQKPSMGCNIKWKPGNEPAGVWS